MAKQRKQYTEEFKRDAVRMMRNRGTRTVTEVADDLGVGGPGRITVQRVTTTWRKSARGALGREHRARLPVAYPLPDIVLVSKSASVYHEVTRGEASSCSERLTFLVSKCRSSRSAFGWRSSVALSASVCREFTRGEASSYRERSAVWFDTQPTAWGGSTESSAVQLTHREAGLEVAFNGTGVAANDAGRPLRSPMPAKLLRGGQIATVRFNGRFVSHKDPWYEDKIIHIAFEVPRSRDLFVSASAAFVIDARVDLW